jgi:GNAT superfamily N-acetyltransferase
MNQIIACGDAFAYDTLFTPQEMAEYLDTYLTTFVATLNGRVVGGYVLRANQPGHGSHVANATYLVASQARGHGIGKMLGEHSLMEARRRGFVAIQFNAVVSTNTGAVTLWQKLGFSIIGTVPNAFRHLDGRYVDFHIMHRPL